MSFLGLNAESWMVLATVLTAVFTGWAIVQRNMDRAKPRMRVFINGVSSWKAGEITFEVVADNIGDGEALGARLSSEHGRGAMENGSKTDFLRRMTDANRLKLFVTVANPLVTPKMVEHADGYIDANSEAAKVPADCAEEIVITWNQPPYRSLKRKKKILLRDLRFSREYV